MGFFSSQQNVIFFFISANRYVLRNVATVEKCGVKSKEYFLSEKCSHNSGCIHLIVHSFGSALTFKRLISSGSKKQECLFRRFYINQSRRQKEAAERPQLKLCLTSTMSTAAATPATRCCQKSSNNH